MNTADEIMPRTRAATWHTRTPGDPVGADVVYASFANQLERELAEAKAEIAGHITEREELGDSYTEMANLYHDAAKQLTAHKAALVFVIEQLNHEKA